jgi:uncharacterized FlgJ-related protein
VANFKPLHITWHGLVLSGLFVWLFGMLLKKWQYQIKMTTINKIGKEIYQLLIESGFNYNQARFITAQSAHETANFTSYLFTKYNNCFGMTFVNQKLASGKINEFATYSNIENSLLDYGFYYRLNNYNKVYSTLTDFIKALKEKSYFEAPEQDYLKGVTNFYNLYFG